MTARIADIIALASRLSCIPVADLLGKSRRGIHTPTRFAICLVAREHGHSYPKIGSHLNRDHSSVIHGVERARDTIWRDPVYQLFVDDLRRIVAVTPPFVEGAPPQPKPKPPAPKHAFLPVRPVVIAAPKPAPKPMPVTTARKARNVFEFSDDDRIGLASQRRMIEGSKRLLEALRVAM